MTVTDNGASDTQLSEADERMLAREAWHASGGTLTGRQLADRYGRPAKWGQRRVIEAKAEVGASADTPPTTPAAAPPPPRKRTRTVSVEPPQTAATGTRTLRRAMAYLSVATVLAVAAVSSYVHIRHLAEQSGMSELAPWLPLALDGMVLGCTCFLMDDRPRSKVDIVIALAGLVIGLAASVAANALAVEDPTPVSVALAVYPPLAVPVTCHLALRMLGER